MAKDATWWSESELQAWKSLLGVLTKGEVMGGWEEGVWIPFHRPKLSEIFYTLWWSCYIPACWERKSQGHSLSTLTQPQKNGPRAWNTSLPRDKEPTHSLCQACYLVWEYLSLFQMQWVLLCFAQGCVPMTFRPAPPAPLSVFITSPVNSFFV